MAFFAHTQAQRSVEVRCPQKAVESAAPCSGVGRTLIFFVVTFYFHDLIVNAE